MLQTIKPDYKLIKYTFSRDNETDVMSPDPPSLQLIPLDFLCEFCQVVILKLKERQKTETNFEEVVKYNLSKENLIFVQTIKKECLNSTDDSSSLCDVINRVNLERLKKGDPKDICESQGMCNGSTGTTTKDNGPPGVSPNQSMGTPAKPANEIERHLTIDEKSVNATLNVEDIAPYN